MNEELLRNARIVLPEDNTEVEPMMQSIRERVAACIADSYARGIPILLWDPTLRQTYLKFPDGHREYRPFPRDEFRPPV